MGECSSATKGAIKDFYVPKHILKGDGEVERISYTPQCPVLVFINSKSGGQLGGELLVSYRKLLNQEQVFDLGSTDPGKVLHKLYGNLEKLKSCGDALAVEVQKRLRLIVAGGDGTASWLLGVVSDLKLVHPPPIATVPLGTGNNLPFSFGWGKKNPNTDCEAVKVFLENVKQATEMKIDSWHIVMRMKNPKEGSCDPVPPLELPHSLHAVHRVSSSDKLNKARGVRFEFRKGATDHTYMRIDGEPWKQPLPLDDDKVVVEISHLGQVNMLATRSCISKSMYDPSSPSSHHRDHDSSSDQDSEEEYIEARKKFGAADTFKLT